MAKAKFKAVSKSTSHSVTKIKGGRTGSGAPGGIFRVLSRTKFVGQIAVAGIGLALVFTTLIGGLFFNLSASQVVALFWSTVVIAFAAFFIFALVAFLGWFLIKSWFLPAIVGSLGLIFICAMLIGLDITPFMDLGAMLEPLLSFLN